MRTLGIVGGIAPPSTVEYYRLVIEIHRARTDGGAPRILINSLDTEAVLSHLANGRRTDLIDVLVGALRQLAAGGADVALLASASVHVVFEDVDAASPLPLVGMVEATAARTAAFRRLGLFATRFTMEADLFSHPLAERGISLIAPTPDEQDLIHAVYFDELVGGDFRPSSRERLVGIGNRLREEHGAEAILLAGTELPLLLPCPSYAGLPYVDSARLHAEAAVEAMLG